MRSIILALGQLSLIYVLYNAGDVSIAEANMSLTGDIPDSLNGTNSSPETEDPACKNSKQS